MPIEIRELIIKTKIVEDQTQKVEMNDVTLTESFYGKMIDKCVVEVLRRLKKKIER